jgi:hypothetical protein
MDHPLISKELQGLACVMSARTVWAEYPKSLIAARPCAGGMYWKREGAYEYLVKTYSDTV